MDNIGLIANRLSIQYEELAKQNEKLREERDSHGPEGRNYTNLQYVTLLNKFQSAQQEIEQLKMNDNLKRQALEEIESLLREDSFENDDTCIEIAHKAQATYTPYEKVTK